jgi:ABC-2 type transport system permease protein
MSNIWRQTFVIARRDFLAVVATPTFLLFLLAPFFMFSFATIGGLGSAHIATSGEAHAQILVIANRADAPKIMTHDTALRTLFNGGPPALKIIAPVGDSDTQAAVAIADGKADVTAVLSGPLTMPHIRYRSDSPRDGRYLATLAENVVRQSHLPVAKFTQPTLMEVKRESSTHGGEQAAGAGAVFVIFLLTLLLAGQTVGMMAEEKANKVIEILAAAVPLEAVFFGKLLGMFAVSVLFIAFWGTLATIGISVLPASISLSNYAPAIGMPTFLILGALYFSMAYMLLGAVFLGVGAQASTMREIQMMSLPITLLQVGMFGLATAASGNPDSDIARFAQIFPFSSPFAMAARGATDATLWPHFIALLWQAFWVGLVVWASARMFARGVLKSGGGWRSLFLSRSKAGA